MHSMGKEMSASLDPSYESALWESSASGDEDARARLIMAYRPMVFWLAKKFRVRPDVYGDLTQEGMVGLISAVDSFDLSRGVKFITYGYYKVFGRMANFLQRGEYKAPLPVEDERIEESAAPDVFETEVDVVEWGMALRDGVETLPDKERSVVRGMMLEGRSASDVAVEHGFGVSHVYRLQRRAIARLRQWFAKEDPSALTTARATS